MKLLRLGICLIFVFMCTACSVDEGKDEFLLMGTMTSEDYQMLPADGILTGKILFYPQGVKMKEVSLVLEEIETKEVVLKKTVAATELKEENLCQIKTENKEGKFVVSLGINDNYEYLEMEQECDFMFASSYHMTKEEDGQYDLLQFLEYHANTPDEVSLLSLHVYQLDKEYIVKLLLS